MKKLYEDSDIQAIATAIRSKDPTQEGNKFKVAEMANAISRISTSGSTDETATLLSLIDRSITSITSAAESVGPYAFYKCKSLTAANFSKATTIEESAFAYCEALIDTDFPKIETIGTFAFAYCYSMTSFKSLTCKVLGNSAFSYSELSSISIPNAETLGYRALSYTKLKTVCLPKVTGVLSYTFANCADLECADFSAITEISAGFSGCNSLKALILRNTDQVIADTGFNGWMNCYHLTGMVNADYNPNGDKDGYFYVPKALLEEYKTATNWTVYADRFRAIEDYSSDGSVTGDIVVS